MWFFKGFVLGICLLVAVLLVGVLAAAAIVTPMYIGSKVFGEYGVLVGLAFEMVVSAGLVGAWAMYEEEHKL